MNGFHENQFFEPADKAEHARANNGSGEPDRCASCSQPYVDHNNDRCPIPDLKTNKGHTMNAEQTAALPLLPELPDQ